MDYLGLNEFIERVSFGELGPGLPIEVRNMGGDRIHRISFMDHCDVLCKKHKIDRLRLLSVIQQKLNNDMIVRLSQSPAFKTKVSSVLGEWGQHEVDPIDLFRCPENCYDSDNVSSLMGVVKAHDTELDSLNESDDPGDHLFNTVEGLRSNYHTCENNLQDQLMEIENRRDEYEPTHGSILRDLSTRHKPFYLDNLLDANENEKMSHHVNKRVNRHIPDKIHMIFLNNVLIPTLIQKEMEQHKHSCMTMKNNITEKQRKLNEIMERLGPRGHDEPFSTRIMDLLSGFGNAFQMDSDGPSDDESGESDNEEQLSKVMKNIVQKNNDKHDKKNINITDSPTDGKVFHLKINPEHGKLNTSNDEGDEGDEDDEGDEGDDYEGYDDDDDGDGDGDGDDSSDKKSKKKAKKQSGGGGDGSRGLTFY
tara:strand:- start:16 stop:1278 length:1263 start_codon:yes stop_codon:yes gene_type:complete